MTKEDKICIGIFIIIISIVFQYYIAKGKRKAKLVNAKYETNYNAWDFILAGDTILNYLHKGEQKTFNVEMEN